MNFSNLIKEYSLEPEPEREPVELEIDPYLKGIMDEAHLHYRRLCPTDPSGSERIHTFSEWLGKTPIGQKFLKRITDATMNESTKRCSNCDGDGRVKGKLCKKCKGDGIIKEDSANPYYDFLKKHSKPPKPISTASEEKLCPICNGHGALLGDECWKCGGDGYVFAGVEEKTKENMKSKFKFNELADQLCESLGDQPIFVHARSAYNKMYKIKNAILTSSTTMRLQMEDNSSVDLSLTGDNPNYQFVMNDGQFISPREVARIYGLLEPSQVVSEDTRYRRGYPYRLDAVKNEKVVGSKTIRNESDLNSARHWMSQQNEQGCNFKKVPLKGMTP